MKVKDIQNIVFDIDETLINHKIQSNSTVTIYKRPYVEELLDYLFANFKHVAIWTHASKFWADLILKRVLKPRPWAFIHTVDDAEHHMVTPTENECKTRGSCSPQKQMIKNLNRLWTTPQFIQMGFKKTNTIIIDDNYYNSALNRANEIISPPYQVPIGELDYDYFCVALLMMLDKKHYGDLRIANIPLIYNHWQKTQERK
jgi:hypothetical protein